ncbi:hypothetical protein QBC39DRAFT_410299 [Podospora conica]|nr:hypothetical protein QBC39DRAFT_410299 [Schizothecium conicum]
MDFASTFIPRANQGSHSDAPVPVNRPSWTLQQRYCRFPMQAAWPRGSESHRSSPPEPEPPRVPDAFTATVPAPDVAAADLRYVPERRHADCTRGKIVPLLQIHPAFHHPPVPLAPTQTPPGPLTTPTLGQKKRVVTETAEEPHRHQAEKDATETVRAQINALIVKFTSGPFGENTPIMNGFVGSEIQVCPSNEATAFSQNSKDWKSLLADAKLEDNTEIRLCRRQGKHLFLEVVSTAQQPFLLEPRSMNHSLLRRALGIPRHILLAESTAEETQVESTAEEHQVEVVPAEEAQAESTAEERAGAAGDRLGGWMGPSPFGRMC